MGELPRRGLNLPRLAVSFALVLGASPVSAQIPFGLDIAARHVTCESGFVTYQSRLLSPALDDEPALLDRGESLSHAFLRSTGNVALPALPDHPVDYEALSSSIAPASAQPGQVLRSFAWLRDEGATEQATGVVIQVFRAQGFVRGSLPASFKAAGISTAAANEALRAFEEEVDPRTVRSGDRFAALVERRIGADGRRIGEDRVVWAELRLYDRRTVAIHRFRPEVGAEQFWFTNGVSVARAPLKAPADASLMSSPFGKREGPILGKRDAMHTGVDYAIGPGTAVPAAAAGIVKAAEPNGGYGKWVLIEHGPGLATAYAHLESFAPGIVAGARVAQGDVIGFTGDTGFSTGPHLHYEVIVDGEAVDPMTHAASVRNMLRGADLERFHAEIGRLLRDYAGTAPLTRLSVR